MSRSGPALQRLREATGYLLGDDARLHAHAAAVSAELRGADPEDVLALWHGERVAALAIHRARSILALEHPSWDEREAGVQAMTERRAGMDELVLRQVTSRLARAGIASIVLKGSPLATRLYGDARLRDPSQDADVLVSAAELFEASQLITTMGWSPPTDPLLANGLPTHHLVLGAKPGLPIIELHWRVQWHDEYAHAQGLLDRLIDVDGLPVLSEVDVLDLLLVVWARDGFDRLRLGADIAAWWRTFGASHGGEVERLYSAPATGRAATLAAQAAARIFGTPAPARRLDDGRARVILAVANANTIGIDQRELTQRALSDVLTCRADQRRARFFSTWMLDPAVSHAAHPWAPWALVPALRIAGALRTAAESLRIIGRALRLGRKRRVGGAGPGG